MYARSFLQIAPVGTSNPISANFAVVSVEIENPSDMWLYLSTLDRFIPPRTTAIRYNLTTPTQSFTVDFVNAPTGGVASAATGGPVIITTYDTPLIDLAGLPYDLLPAINSLIAAINALGVKIDLTNATLATLDTDVLTLISTLQITNTDLEILGAGILPNILRATGSIAPSGGLTIVIAAAPAGQQHHILGWRIVPSMTIVGAMGITGNMDAVLLNGAGALLDHDAMDPAKPWGGNNLFPYGIPAGIANDVRLQTIAQDASNPTLNYVIYYYTS